MFCANIVLGSENNEKLKELDAPPKLSSGLNINSEQVNTNGNDDDDDDEASRRFLKPFKQFVGRLQKVNDAFKHLFSVNNKEN
ncbi:hypothetical protein RR48_07054 [Papilio machaon]|uniref:Uncharacterized protein n=1 Tax=Papilio machaon TaxID=76193 RepID=A0A194R7I1_PAPMA|nr:hypothetical protein RR48_07054 [Papilio machaon]